MFIKRLFCRNHEWEKTNYEELLDDTGRVISRVTYFKCKKCGKKHEQVHWSAN